MPMPRGRWGQQLAPSQRSVGTGGWLHEGDDSDQCFTMGPLLLVGCSLSQESGGSSPHLVSGPSVVAVVHASGTLDGSGGSRRPLQLM